MHTFRRWSDPCGPGPTIRRWSDHRSSMHMRRISRAVVISGVISQPMRLLRVGPTIGRRISRAVVINQPLRPMRISKELPL